MGVSCLGPSKQPVENTKADESATLGIVEYIARGVWSTGTEAAVTSDPASVVGQSQALQGRETLKLTAQSKTKTGG